MEGEYLSLDTAKKLHKFQDTTGGLTYEERKLLEILKGSDKE